MNSRINGTPRPPHATDPPVAATSAQPAATPAAPAMRLGAWNLYFLVKLALFWQGSIRFHPLENLAFAAFLLVPLRSRTARRVRGWIAVPIGAALLYHDSWLPSPSMRMLSQLAQLLSGFSLAYLLELTERLVRWPVVASLVLIWATYRIVALRVRVGVPVVVAMAVLALVQRPDGVPGGAVQTARGGDPTQPGGAGEPRDPDQALRAFYASEAQRSVRFDPPAATDVPFDLIFVHICSLSWDDLHAMGLQDHRLWKRLDIVLTRFNSAASYSGPAAIRILRASCGQAPHEALYSAAPEGCLLMGGLRAAGFEPHLVLNHDGRFDNFLSMVRSQGGLDVAPMPLDGIPVAQKSFDGSPIFDDLAVLSRWLQARGAHDAPRVAAFFNSISLHDGNRLVGAESARSSRDTYRIRLTKLLDDLDNFLQRLEASGRRSVVALVPEHGAALRGDRMQIPGLREIPSPAITLVPVGLKVIGPDARRADAAVRIDTPTSYLAVSQILARMLQRSPFAAGGFAAADYVGDLPATEFVSENETTVTMRHGGKYLLRLGREGWSEYEPAATPP